ncbi:hypothetical protein PULV_b0051 [Pseudoalteromonas ulvae UL12]|nr:hypothetical protein [Pseudoalteromonas ulvae UL12]
MTPTSTLLSPIILTFLVAVIIGRLGNEASTLSIDKQSSQPNSIRKPFHSIHSHINCKTLHS